MAPANSGRADTFERVMRWVALAWLVVWFPAYARVWGWTNFLHLCDVAVLLSVAGFVFRSPLLLSSQAIGTAALYLAWWVEALTRCLTGRDLTGGLDYMWDARYPLWVRLLSLFHVVLPILLIWAVARRGYERRALALESAIVTALLVVSRFYSSALNLNYAYRDPILHRALGPAPVHLAAILATIIVVGVLPVHVLLTRWCLAPRNRTGLSSA